ncbi:DEAD/DEAH box helicase family protein [Nanchangia anserum]|uniref:DEAD/DEAH box helicase family protein n=1 Tax=Nanchangia anserum TaxID=2692125 RepID=UPI001D11E43F|nr:DEAD/DEAH box helicase family protein [Nanchangia anserum]
MTAKLSIGFDSEMLESISAEFDLRAPNKEALRQLIFTLDGDYDPGVMQVLNLATGVGKTYLMAAFIEYLRRQGVGNVVIVTPGKDCPGQDGAELHARLAALHRRLPRATAGGDPAGLLGVDRPPKRSRPPVVWARGADAHLHLQHPAAHRPEVG